MLHDQLLQSLFDVAREMTGERRDTRYRAWARRIDGVDLEQKTGRAFEGQLVKAGKIELVKMPCVFLVMFRHGSRENNVGEYAVVTMDAEGNLHPTEIMTNDEEGGWALKIRDDVADLVVTLTKKPLPNLLNTYEIEQLQAEINRRTPPPRRRKRLPYKLILFDLENTLAMSWGDELLPGVAEWFAQESHLPAVIVSNQGGVGLRYWMETGKFGEPDEYPTQEQVLARLQRLAHHSLDNTPVYASWAYQSQKGKWSPAPSEASEQGFGLFQIHAGRGIVSSWRQDWRKPNTGMLVLAMEQAGVTPENALMVGDQASDQEAARAAGCAYMPAHIFFCRSHSGLIADVYPRPIETGFVTPRTCVICESLAYAWFRYWVYSKVVKDTQLFAFVVCEKCNFLDYTEAVLAIEAASAKEQGDKYDSRQNSTPRPTLV